MSVCNKPDIRVVEVLVREQIIRQPYILNLFLTDWFNMPLHRIRELYGTFIGPFVYNIENMVDATKKGDWRRVISIMMSTIASAGEIYNRIDRVNKAMKNQELVETGLFKIIIDPYIPLGIYVAIGQLLPRPITRRIQRVYFIFYNKILEKRIKTRALFKYDDYSSAQQELSIKKVVFRSAKELLKEAAKQFVINRIKDQIISSIGRDLPSSDLEDAKRLISSFGGLTRPLGLLVYGVHHYIKMKDSVLGKEKAILEEAKKILTDTNSLSSMSFVFRYNNFISKLPTFMCYVDFPSKFVNVVLDNDTGYYQTFTYAMPIVPLNLFSTLGSGFTDHDKEYIYTVSSGFKSMNVPGSIIPSTFGDIQKEKFGSSEQYYRNILDSGLYSKSVYNAMKLYDSAFDTLSGSNNPSIKMLLMSSLLVPIGEDMFDTNRLRSIMSVDGDLLSSLSTLQIENALVDQSDSKTGEEVFDQAKTLRRIIEPLAYFVAKSVEATRRYLSMSDLSSESLLMVSLEPFSYFIPELPEVFGFEWYREIYPNYNVAELEDKLPFNTRISIYKDILPLKSFKLTYENIESESVNIYNKKIEVPAKWEAFLPKISIEIYDTAERYLYNYFSEYRKRVFIKGAVRPPLDISFILDVIRLRADYSVQDFISLIVVPTSIELEGIEYSSEDHFVNKVLSIPIEFSVIGYINYTEVGASSALDEKSMTLLTKPGAAEGMIDFSTGYFMLPSFRLVRSDKSISVAHDRARMAADVNLLRWYALYNNLPITAEYGSLGTDVVDALFGAKLKVSIKPNTISDKDQKEYWFETRVTGMSDIDYSAAYRVIENSQKGVKIVHNPDVINAIYVPRKNLNQSSYIKRPFSAPKSFALFDDNARKQLSRSIIDYIINE